MYKYINAIDHGAWHEIQLNRPKKRNALSPEMLHEIGQATDDAEQRDGVKALLFTSTSSHFSAGFDVTTSTSDQLKGAWLANKATQRVIKRIRDSSIVTACLMDGYVVGAGFMLAAACQLRYATPGAMFYIPELQMGIPFSIGGVSSIARVIGLTRVAELVLTGEAIAATDYRMINFLTKIIEPDSIRVYVEEKISKVVNNPQALLLATVSTLREASYGILGEPADDLFALLYAGKDASVSAVQAEYKARFTHLMEDK